MKNTGYWDLANTSHTHRIVLVAPIQNPADQVEECPEEGRSLYSLSLTESEVGQSNSCNLLSLGDDGSFGGDLFDNLSAEDVIILPDEPMRQRSTVYPDITTPPTEWDSRYLDQGEQSLQDFSKEGGCLQKTTKYQTGGFLQALKEKCLFSGRKQAIELEERPQTTIGNVRSLEAHQFHGEMFCQVKRSHRFPALDKLAEDKFHRLGSVQCYSTTCWHEDSPLSDSEDEWQHSDWLGETTSVQTWSSYDVSTASPSPGAPHLTPIPNGHQMTDDTRSLAPPSPDWPLFMTWDPRSPLAGRSLMSLEDISDLVVPFSGEDNKSLFSANPFGDSYLKPTIDTFLNNQAHGRDMATTQEEKGNKEVKQGISSQQESEGSEILVAQKKGKKSLRKSPSSPQSCFPALDLPFTASLDSVPDLLAQPLLSCSTLVSVPGSLLPTQASSGLHLTSSPAF
ncbi:uncharacterized protein LOC109615157 [Esox lucius]|uniref:uncharacterized protein LOC109615157 n=1 Tax=Esox lucius TaxID=8010 RepID=UPI0010BDBC5B|nr:uncharacterized protein LOC109615157 [Esox lucius]